MSILPYADRDSPFGDQALSLQSQERNKAALPCDSVSTFDVFP